MGIHSEAGLNRKFVEFARLLNIYLNHFPKHEKYALANRIRNTAYEVYDLISEGQKRLFSLKCFFGWPMEFSYPLVNSVVIEAKFTAPTRKSLGASFVGY